MTIVRFGDATTTFRRHKTVALLVFALTTAGASVGLSYLGRTHEATVQLVRLTSMPAVASDNDDELIRQAQSRFTDEDVLAVQRRFHLYLAWFPSALRSRIVHGIRAKVTFCAVSQGGLSAKQLSVSFTGRTGTHAREVISAIAADISRPPASADRHGFAPDTVLDPQHSQSGGDPKGQRTNVVLRSALTRHMTLLQQDLENAHQQESTIQSSLETTANGWAHLHRELMDRAIVDASPATLSRLNQQKAELEPQIISLQRALEAMRKQERQWNAELTVATSAPGSDNILSSILQMPENASPHELNPPLRSHVSPSPTILQ